MSDRVDDESQLFADFTDYLKKKEIKEIKKTTVKKGAFCKNCDVSLISLSEEWKCPNCFKIYADSEIQIINPGEHEPAYSSTIRINVGKGKVRQYNGTQSPAIAQANYLKREMQMKQSNNTVKIPSHIIEEALNQYHQIQQHVTVYEYDDNGNVAKNKNFVKRGELKDGVIAVLIYFICAERVLHMKKTDIEKFMNLRPGYFSKGERLLRELDDRGIYKIKINPNVDNAINSFVERYLKNLGAWSEGRQRLACNIVNRANDLNIGVTNTLMTRVAGAIWMVIERAGVKVSVEVFEKAVDNVRKNTFTKFINGIIPRIGEFEDLFVEFEKNESR